MQGVKYTFKCERTDPSREEVLVLHETDAESYDALLTQFLYFLRGCSFEIEDIEERVQY